MAAHLWSLEVPAPPREREGDWHLTTPFDFEWIFPIPVSSELIPNTLIGDFLTHPLISF